MSVLPLHPIRNFESYKSGEVKIDPSAAIAPGVVLQAEPNSQIIIGAGTCIGMGVVLHARAGILEVEAGATLGAGVLVVGTGKIGSNACVGSATTILNQSVAPGQVIAPGSLIGDTSRQMPELADQNIATSAVEVALSVTSSPKEQNHNSSQLVPESAKHSRTPIVYGKASLHQLMVTLFPHKQSLSQPSPDNSSQSDST